jgi:CCR4-NOT transcriptional regulation complex NOT5 subunit
MSVTLKISEKIYNSLEQQAQKRELESVEKFLEQLTRQFEKEEAAEWEKELERRRKVGNEIRTFRKKMKDKYGIMPDSTELLREDRMRG